jgi:sigma-B regulation protein RsbU (phosphoserine phosphatase)
VVIRNKLAVKMSLYILTGIFSVFLFIIVYNYQVSRKIILKETEMNAFNLSQSTLHQVENLLLPAQKIPDNLAYILENSSFTKERLEDLLKIIVQNNHDIFGSSIAFEPYSFQENTEYYAPYCYRSGDSVILSDLGGGGYNYTNWNWYRLPLEKGAGWGEPYFDKGGGNIIMITYSVPFYWNEDNLKLKGVVTVDLSLEKLRELIGKMKIYNSGYAFLLSPSGVYISHPDSQVVVKESIFSFASKHNLADLTAIGHDMVSGKTSFMQYYSLFLIEKCYLFHTSLESNNWSLAVVIPEKEILVDLYSLNQRILLIGIAGFLAILIIIVIISRNITTPLRKLAGVARLIGAGNFDIKLPENHSKDEIGQLSDSFLQMQIQLKEYILNLKEVTAARQKMQSELKIAHDIQQGIIPKTFPPFPQRNDIDIYATLIPARDVGGDLYDYFFVEDDILAITVGDVSGKGIPASLLMAITRTLFRSRTQKKMKVNEIVREMNADLCRDNENTMFVTLFLGLLNVKTGEFEYCNAGHNYPYIIRKEGAIVCLDDTHGTPLGIFEDKPYGCSTVRFYSRDFLVLYTDGVTEAMDGAGNLFGEDRLEEVLSGHDHHFSVKEITNCILDDMAKFTKEAEQSDDITILAMSYK